ncbi:peptidyl-tRNA hydrolase 2, mitochondrial isoform X1 [Nasonia vitripennis]|uniref:peptidyl-tRNA hydrolase n=1 Tax=Nasonia vitripennis TaxID=7425 RepID=A0A7M7GEL9_NASVI|nr:peptidyl-tRNA hydrolase 2, mitochondrial isoform X1 [Nasonia vitripennis]
MSLFPRTLQKLVLIVRTDLSMGQGKIASQCAHAALECYLKASKGFFKPIGPKLWLMTGQPKIVLRVQSETELMSLAEAAKKAGLSTVAIRDAGRTQLKPGTVTVLGIGPGAADRVDSVTSHLKLL